jgi:cytochrome c553
MVYLKLVAATAVLAITVISQPAAAEGDAEKGAVLAYSCMGCHGIDGYRNSYPSYRVPKIGGQKAAYVESALKAYKDGSRKHPTMNAQGSSLSDADIANLVAWLAAYKPVSDQTTAESVAGTDAAQACVACHGVAGASVVPQPPTLAGQHRDYLVHALKQYRDGTRAGTVMSAFAAALSDEDIEAVSQYYASLKGLYTPEGKP